MTAHAMTSPAAAAGGRAVWTLPEDGIIDPVAIEIAATGARPVQLTPAERRLAAARILARGGGASLIARRLHVSGSTARRFVAAQFRVIAGGEQ